MSILTPEARDILLGYNLPPGNEDEVEDEDEEEDTGSAPDTPGKNRKVLTRRTEKGDQVTDRDAAQQSEESAAEREEKS